MKNFTIKLVTDSMLASDVALFFAANVPNTYISHGDIIDERAINITTWNPDLTEIFFTDAIAAINNSELPLADGLHLVAAFSSGLLSAIMLYEFSTGHRSRAVLLHDIVVKDSLRNQGVGTAMLAWLEKETRQMDGGKNFFLESGLNNHSAHCFFEHLGFKQTSIVMMKAL